MAEYNMKWAELIKGLLDKRGLSARAAERFVNGAVSYTYIAHMLQGKVPRYETAIAFLNHFPYREAIECLRAVGMPWPEAWQEEPTDALELVEGALCGADNLSDVAKAAGKGVC